MTIDHATEPPNPPTRWGVGSIGHGLALTARSVLGRRTPWLDKVLLLLAALLVVFAVLGALWRPDDPYLAQPAIANLAPSLHHLFGTDDLGRDVLSRLLAGAAPTLLAALAIVAVSTVVGVIVAGVAACAPKLIDDIIMRICDIFLIIPGLVLALGIAATLGESLVSASIAMVVVMWPGTARLMRGILRQTMASSYVEAARVMGMSRWRAFVRHALPNSFDAILVQGSMEISGVIVLLAGLSYLGAGAPAPSAHWGAMVAEGQSLVGTSWWIAVVPGAAITLAAIVFGLLGDSLRARLDPTLRGGRR